MATGGDAATTGTTVEQMLPHPGSPLLSFVSTVRLTGSAYVFVPLSVSIHQPSSPGTGMKSSLFVPQQACWVV